MFLVMCTCVFKVESYEKFIAQLMDVELTPNNDMNSVADYSHKYVLHR